MPLIDTLLVVLAYLLGSLSTAIIASRAMGLPDPRGQGSGNPGATNVLRTGGRHVAAVTLVGDMLKGLLPVLLGRALGVPDAALGLVGLVAFAGHVYPLYYGFRGGKGVATALGVLLGIHWLAGLLTILTWLIVASIWRISSLSALVAALLAPAYVVLATGSAWLTAAAAVMTLLIYWRHRSNIRSLLAGTEGRIGARD